AGSALAAHHQERAEAARVEPEVLRVRPPETEHRQLIRLDGRVEVILVEPPRKREVRLALRGTVSLHESAPRQAPAAAGESGARLAGKLGAPRAVVQPVVTPEEQG